MSLRSEEWLIGFLILVTGGLIKGTVGMGFPLFSAPFLAPYLGVQYTVTFLAVPMFLTSVYMTLKEGRLLSILRRFWSLMVLLFLGTWLGVLGLSVLDPSVLFVVLGLVTIIFVFLNFVQIKSKFSSLQEIGTIGRFHRWDHRDLWASYLYISGHFEVRKK